MLEDRPPELLPLVCVGECIVKSRGSHADTLCRDPDADREVAVKVILLGSNNAAMSRRLMKLFQTEAGIGRRLDHPNIVSVYDRGETDDHTWAWIPSHQAVAVGDFVAWVFPNAGNPQKVQRYPGEWAAALRKMLALEPELLLPAHGLAVAGRERVATVLGDLATALERLVADVVAGMNAGATLDEIVHAVRVDDDLIHRPWLRPIYDEPEFVVRNTYRLYGGWWDGNPATLKPAGEAALARARAYRNAGADIVIVNGERTELDSLASVVVNADLNEALPLICGGVAPLPG